MIPGDYDYAKLGDHNAWCMRCGMKRKASMLVREWTGLRVCADCVDPRHPQELIRAVKESPPPSASQSPRNDGASALDPFPDIGDSQPIPGTPLYTPPTGGEDNAGSTYYIPFGPADKSTL